MFIKKLCCKNNIPFPTEYKIRFIKLTQNRKIRMTNQHLHKNTIRHRKNNQWLQRLETQENHTKMKIFKFQENCHKPSLLKELEMFFKVTPCNEKCNFFILLSFNLLKSISLLRIFLIGIIRFRWVRISPMIQNIANNKNKESFKNMVYEICSNNLSKWIRYIESQTIRNQWIKGKVKDTKFIPTL